MELGWIAGTDGQAAADALVSNHARLVEAEAAEFVLAAHWADLHDEHTLTTGSGSGSGSGRVLPGTERARRYGGAGTPLVGEFAAAELGCLVGRGPEAAGTLLADALDVRHRLPAHWAALTSGEARVWQVRQVAIADPGGRAVAGAGPVGRRADRAVSGVVAVGAVPEACSRRRSSRSTEPLLRRRGGWRRRWSGSWRPGSATSTG